MSTDANPQPGQAGSDQADHPEPMPVGFLDRDQARQLFGITARQFKRWVNNGTVGCGVMVHSRIGGRRMIFPAEGLRKLREELFARDALYNNAAGNFCVPDGWSRPHEARRMFGVDKATWERWRSEGRLPRGERFDGGPTLYRIEDLKRVMYDQGRLATPYPDGSGAYRVPLCGRESGRSAEGREAIIDAPTLALLDGAVLAWQSVSNSDAVFVALCRADKPGGIALRRLVMGVSDDGLQVGHINGDPLDCRRANLVVRTIQQRSCSAKKMRGVNGIPCSSRFKGVCWDKQTQKWRARIVVDGRSRKLGRHSDEIAAAQAYDEAARELHGKHARLNFPDGVDAWLETESRQAA